MHEKLFMSLQLSLTGLTIILSVISVNRNRNKRDIFQPFNIIAGLCFLIQVFAPMSWLLEGRSTWFSFPVLEYLPKANALFFVGYLAYWVGYSQNYRYVIRESQKKLIISEDDPLIVKFASALFFVSLFVYLVYLFLRGRSLISQLTLGQLGQYGQDVMMQMNESSGAMWFLMKSLDSLICSAVLLLIYGKKHRVLSIAAYIIVLLLTISSGWRFLMMIILLAPVVHHFRVRGRQPKLHVIMIVVIVLFIFVGYIGAMRDIYRSGIGEIRGFNLSSTYRAFMVNIEVFFPFYNMVGFIPSEYPHAFGLSYIMPFVMLVPRFLWPGKPLPPSSEMFIALYGDMAKTGPAVAVWGEFYHNFGLVGIIVGMFLVGYISKRIYISSKNSNFLTNAGYSFFIPFLFQYITRGDASGIFVDIIFLFGPIFLTVFGIKYLKKLRINSTIDQGG